jgi:hypothetical protein
MPRQSGVCAASSISILDTGAAMREGLLRDRPIDDQTAEGAVDKSVVNWLMHVISGKAPIELGINDAREEASKTAEARPKIVSPREEVKEKAAATPAAPPPPTPVPGLAFTAEDLCGAPLFPLVNEVHAIYDEITADDLCFVPKKLEPEPEFRREPEPELSRTTPVKRTTGSKLIEMSMSKSSAYIEPTEPGEAEPPALDLLREGADYTPPLVSAEATAAIAESLRTKKVEPAQPMPDEISPAELTRDPDYYQEKMQPHSVAVDEVDWIPSEPEPTVIHVPEVIQAAADSAAAVEEWQVEPEVKATEPVAVAAEPEVVETVSEPAPQIVEAVPEVAAAPVQEPEPEVAHVAHAVPATAAIVDPFAGVEFSSEPEVKAAEVVAAVAGPEVVSVPREPEALQAAPEAVAAPEVVAAEPEVVAAPVMAEPEVAAPVESKTEPEPETVTVAEPIAEIPVEAKPEVIYEALATAEVATEGIPAAKADALVAEPMHEPESAGVSELPWMAVAAQHNPKDKTFSVDEFYRHQPGNQQPAKAVAEAVMPKTAEKPEDLTAALKTLMQLGSVLPLAARMAPMLEAEQNGEPAAGGSQEVKQEVSGLRLLQYEIKTTVQDHSMHLKRLEDQLTQVRESVEMDSAESATVMDSVKSTVKLVRVMGIGLGVMLMVLILMIGMMLVHAK